MEASKSISGFKDEGLHYNFTEISIESVTMIVGGQYRVKTNEMFIFTNHEGKEVFYDCEKFYIISQEDDRNRIYQIEIDDTNRSDL
ncbi:hypothetical protein LCM20_12235 [Halobacillus litoralis]|nr:hypothetical protein [Halobacillus litoralis]MCA0971365.1 hypothetical protein [Halobacillus litoralis]